MWSLESYKQHTSLHKKLPTVYSLFVKRQLNLHIEITLINDSVIFYDIHPQFRIVTQNKFQPEFTSLKTLIPFLLFQWSLLVERGLSQCNKQDFPAVVSTNRRRIQMA